MGLALTLLLVCGALRLGHQTAAAAHKARLQVTPVGGAVPAGGRVSLRCLCQVPCARLFLYRGAGPIPVRRAEAQGQAAEFPIAQAGPSDAGSYRCRYLSRQGQPRWSESSDPVQLVVAVSSLNSSPPAPSRGPSPTSPAPLAHSHSPLPGVSPDSSPRPHTGGSPTSPAAPMHSDSPLPAPATPRHPDFTQGNLVRLGLGAGVLLALALGLATSCCSWERGGPHLPHAPRPRPPPDAPRSHPVAPARPQPSVERYKRGRGKRATATAHETEPCRARPAGKQEPPPEAHGRGLNDHPRDRLSFFGVHAPPPLRGPAHAPPLSPRPRPRSASPRPLLPAPPACCQTADWEVGTEWPLFFPTQGRELGVIGACSQKTPTPGAAAVRKANGPLGRLRKGTENKAEQSLMLQSPSVSHPVVRAPSGVPERRQHH
ncbi:uncharacterized protein LOC102453256 isoform X2 [Pelodiscus sinensis]|uniref:uncharacterized protein LOC102453256 isoform X2 n=1 Tax=Pelodiscus sinensis TaxID=13735 RepID=UPI003F6B2632